MLASSGAPARTLVTHSNISPSPAPFGPPMGSEIAAFAGSVVELPSASSAHPSGIGFFSRWACLSLPFEATEVAMSSTMAPSGPPGTPMASGLVERLGARAP